VGLKGIAHLVKELITPIIPVLWSGSSAGAYTYTLNLLTLSRRVESAPSLEPAVSGLNHIQTPMQVDVWAKHLTGHPDQAYCGYLLKGI